jgi:hypothetical protein
VLTVDSKPSSLHQPKQTINSSTIGCKLPNSKPLIILSGKNELFVVDWLTVDGRRSMVNVKPSTVDHLQRSRRTVHYRQSTVDSKPSSLHRPKQTLNTSTIGCKLSIVNH